MFRYKKIQLLNKYFHKTQQHVVLNTCVFNVNASFIDEDGAGISIMYKEIAIIINTNKKRDKMYLFFIYLN